MIRLSCFSAHTHHKSKTAVHRPKEVPPGEMPKVLPKHRQDSGPRVSPHSSCSNSKTEDGILSNSMQEPFETPCSSECCWRQEDLDSNSCNGDSKEGHQATLLKKSHSLGSGLDRGKFLCDVEANGTGEKLTCINSDERVPDKVSESLKNHTFSGLYENQLGIERPDQIYSNSEVRSLEVNVNPISQGSLFSIGDLQQFDGDLPVDSCEQLCAEPLDLSGSRHVIQKSRSLPMLDMHVANNGGELLSNEHLQRSKSFQDLITARTSSQDFYSGREFEYNSSDVRHGASSDWHNDIIKASSPEQNKWDSESYPGGNGCSKDIAGQVEHLVLTEGKTHNNDTCCRHLYDSHNLSTVVDAWSDHESQGGIVKLNDHEEATLQSLNELSGQEFNVRRIEQWLSHIDFHRNDPIEENPDTSSSVAKNGENQVVSSASTTKANMSSSPSMEAAYNYISSLTATSTLAQMANLGLVVIPFLSAFTSLRIINLAGNSIVRITAGALPRGLHTLNLSRNNISTIEGLRELARLRVLDLSYNRILKIGHGLAACTSLKELYLAGNKISEVEGLHRLLKLSILDLRGNKISTAKCLGQLAANYGSLQALNLEGNPAQRNVGDDQLKKHVLNLLPRLVYFNKQTIRTSSSKDVSERFSRAATSHQFDRGTRDQKRHRRGHHSGSHRLGAVSSDGKHGQTLSPSVLKQSRGRHAPLPPLGSIPSNHNFPSPNSKLLSLHLSNPIRRSRSEGNL